MSGIAIVGSVLVQDLVGALVFLASAAAAPMTGSSMVINGGWPAE